MADDGKISDSREPAREGGRAGRGERAAGRGERAAVAASGAMTRAREPRARALRTKRVDGHDGDDAHNLPLQQRHVVVLQVHEHFVQREDLAAAEGEGERRWGLALPWSGRPRVRACVRAPGAPPLIPPAARTMASDDATDASDSAMGPSTKWPPRLSVSGASFRRRGGTKSPLPPRKTLRESITSRAATLAATGRAACANANASSSARADAGSGIPLAARERARNAEKKKKKRGQLRSHWKTGMAAPRPDAARRGAGGQPLREAGESGAPTQCTRNRAFGNAARRRRQKLRWQM